MSLRSMIQLIVVVLLAAVPTVPVSGIAAEGVPEAAAENQFGDLDLPQIDITITDTAFEGVPAELNAGRYIIAVTGATSEPFSVGGVFIQMPEGLATAEFVDYMATPRAVDVDAHRPQPWYYEARHTGAPYVFPGETRYAVVDLTAGEWAFTTEYRVAPQAPVPFTVTGEFPDDLPTPAADLTIEMSEFAFSYSMPLSSGPQVVEITNVGDQHHYYVLGTWPEGTTVEVLQAFVEADHAGFSGMPSTPMTMEPLVDLSWEDSEEIFSTAKQSAGVTAWYAIDLAPGTYGTFCFEHDPGTDLPHTVLGQVHVAVVE